MTSLKQKLGVENYKCKRIYKRYVLYTKKVYSSNRLLQKDNEIEFYDKEFKDLIKRRN